MVRYQGSQSPYKKRSHRKLGTLILLYYMAMLPILYLVCTRSLAGAASDLPVIATILVASLVGLWWMMQQNRRGLRDKDWIRAGRQQR